MSAMNKFTSHVGKRMGNEPALRGRGWAGVTAGFEVYLSGQGFRNQPPEKTKVRS